MLYIDTTLKRVLKFKNSENKENKRMSYEAIEVTS